jgi:hypothetical protein
MATAEAGATATPLACLCSSFASYVIDELMRRPYEPDARCRVGQNPDLWSLWVASVDKAARASVAENSFGLALAVGDGAGVAREPVDHWD